MSQVHTTREMARKFNRIFGDVFPEPEPLVTKFSRFPGTDGKRMSKSLGNTIEISASPEEIVKKIKPAFTDPARMRRTDPGNPDICAIYTWYQKFMPAEVEETASECRSASRGCVDCKMNLAQGVIEHFAPLRERRAEFENNPKHLDEIISAGCEKAKVLAAQTMEKVHQTMGIG